MSKSPEELAHLEWLGYVQPVEQLVSVPTSLEAQCYVNTNIVVEQACFVNGLPRQKSGEPISEIGDPAALTQKGLGWEAEDFIERMYGLIRLNRLRKGMRANTKQDAAPGI